MWSRITSLVNFYEKMSKDKNYERLAIYIASVMSKSSTIDTIEKAKKYFDENVAYSGNCNKIIYRANIEQRWFKYKNINA